jgi:hypothetical protein
VSDRRAVVATFSTTALSLAYFFSILIDVFDILRDDLVIVPALRLAMLSPQKIAPRIASNFCGAAAGQQTLKT